MSDYTREKLQFPSSDGKNTVTGYLYLPAAQKPRAVLQLSHGMCEYIRRYEPAIAVLTAAGFAVCGNDHLGHGDTAKPEDYGFAAEKNGETLILKDLYQMNQLVHGKLPGLPYFVLGHSMGSFYARWFAEQYPDALDGLIISGTGGPNAAIGAGRLLASTLSKLKGPRYVSPLMVSMSTGSYCKGIEQDGSPNAWLSRDPAVWAAYAADPMCGFSFTVSAYRDMLTVYGHVSKKSWAQNLRKNMPVLIYSGQRDPVGAYGKGVEAVHAMLQQAGLQDLTLKLYPEGRHEMHNELNKEEVLADLTAWLEKHL